MHYVDQGISCDHECEQHIIYGSVCRALDEEEYGNHVQTFYKYRAACDVFEFFKSFVEPLYEQVVTDQFEDSDPHQMAVFPELRHGEHADQQGDEYCCSGDCVDCEQT